MCLIKYNAVKAYGEVEIKYHSFLTSALDKGWRSASRFGRFNIEENAPSTN
jgi:hypothetical protein